MSAAKGQPRGERYVPKEDWTAEELAQLRALWAEDLSSAEIGRRMKRSKNSVVGKAHRLNLPSRPSPIRRDLIGKPRREAPPPRTKGPTLPPLPTQEPGPVAEVVIPAPQAPTPQPVPVPAPAPASKPAPIAPARPVERPTPPRLGRTAECCWPIGDPREPEFRFCKAAPVQGKPYCTEHHERAYVKVGARKQATIAQVRQWAEDNEIPIAPGTTPGMLLGRVNTARMEMGLPNFWIDGVKTGAAS